MKKLSNSKLLNIFIRLLLLVLIAKGISVGVLWLLPDESPSVEKQNVNQMPYQYYNFQNMISGDVKTKHSQKNKRQNIADIKNMLLIGLYGNKHYGYAIVAMKKTPQKTSIISIGESFQGYTLKEIALEKVVFYKNNKEYVLRLNRSQKNAKKLYSPYDKKQTNEDTEHTISRQEINEYIKNPDKLWKDISINEVKKNGKIEGFKVTKIRKNSQLAQMGLQRGDIIIEANNTPLTSYAKVLQMYQNIDKLEKLSIIVKRGNQKKELIYEIY